MFHSHVEGEEQLEGGDGDFISRLFCSFGQIGNLVISEHTHKVVGDIKRRGEGQKRASSVFAAIVCLACHNS